MARAVALFAIVVVSGVVGTFPIAAQARDQFAASQTAAGATQLAERMIVCGRSGCWKLREGCRLVRAPHPRNNRVLCGPAGVA